MYEEEEAGESHLAMTVDSMKALVPTKKFNETRKRMQGLSYSDDGNGMVVSGEDVIFVYDLTAGVKIKSIECKKYGVGEVLFLDPDKCLHSSKPTESSKHATEDHAVRLLSIHSKSYVRYFLGHTKTVNGVIKNPTDGETFITSSEDKTVRVWDKRTYENIGFININHVPLVAYDPEGLIFAVATESEKIKLFDVRSFDVGPFKTLIDQKIDDDKWTNIEFSPCGRFILISTSSGSLKWIDAFCEKNASPIHIFKGHQNPNNISLKASVSTDSQFVMVGSADNLVYIYSTESGEIVEKLETKCSTPCHVVAFNKKQFMMTTLSKQVVLWAPREDYIP